jgi:hypothetical protein
MDGFSEKDLHLNIYDCTGKMVYSRSCEAKPVQNVDMGGYAEGVYFVEISSAGEHVSLQKLIIQR